MPKHKYIEKIKISPKYTRYFYSIEEYKTYLLGGNHFFEQDQVLSKASIGKNFVNGKLDNLRNKYSDALKNKNIRHGRDYLVKHIPDAIAPITSKIASDFLKDLSLDNEKGHNANDDKYDNDFSEQHVLDTLSKQSELSIPDDPKLEKKVLDNYTKRETGESMADACQRSGLLDEKMPGCHPETFSDLKKLDEDIDDDIDMEAINYDNLYALGYKDVDSDPYPDGADVTGYSTNCAYCTLAYEMRQRGYDVEASACYIGTNNTEEVIETWYENGEFIHPKNVWNGDPSIEELEKSIIENSGEGSRGQFCCFWYGGIGGHSMVYEVRDGSVYIRDCQLNKEFEMNTWPYADNMTEPMYMRTDNLELTDASLVGVKNKRRRK